MDERAFMQMEYPLCNQTVTVYRLVDGQVCRRVLENCYLEVSAKAVPGDCRQEQTFLLVVPGQETLVQPGDRVLPGVGPEAVSWERLLPVFVKELLVVSQVKRFYWEGAMSHLEAS